MSRLVTFEDKKALLAEDSDTSSSDMYEDKFDDKISSKSIYYTNLAK